MFDSPYDRDVLARLRISVSALRFEPVKAIDAWVVVDLRETGIVVRAFDLSLPDPEGMARKYAAERNREGFSA
jgi:hypothetical protein